VANNIHRIQQFNRCDRNLEDKKAEGLEIDRVRIAAKESAPCQKVKFDVERVIPWAAVFWHTLAQPQSVKAC